MAGRPRRPSAALLLGVLSGLLAAFAVLPTAVAQYFWFESAEYAVAEQQAAAAAAIAARLVDPATKSLPLGTRERLRVEALAIRAKDGTVAEHDGPEVPAAIFEEICGKPEPVTIMVGPAGKTLAYGCSQELGVQVVAAATPGKVSILNAVTQVLLLSAIVGIVTALAVLRLLTPLSRVSQALVRVRAGERGVRVARTPLTELDDLVQSLNEAARAVEDREDAILERIQLVQEMARLVAHEVRNPLQSLELMISLMSSETDERERYDLAASMRTEIRALDMVVNRLLKRGGEGLRLLRAPARIGDLVEQVVNLRRPEANARGIRLSKGPVSSRETAIDQALLGRCIDNLIVNALQAVANDVGIVRVSLYEDGDTLVVSVEDNGPGVNDSLAGQIFEPNVSGRDGGTGLGLTLVKGVVEAHGGRIAHGRSQLGGAEFSLRLPLGVEGDDGDTERVGGG